VGELEEHRGDRPAEQSLLVLQNVKDEASQHEVGNGDAASNDKLICDLSLELFLDDVQEFSQNALLELLDGLGLLVLRGKEGDPGGLVEDVIVGFYYHIDHTASFPVGGLVVAVLYAELAEDCERLLAGFTPLVNNRHSTEFASFSSGLACTPSLKRHIDGLNGDSLVGHELDERVFPSVVAREVLNLDDLAGRLLESTGWWYLWSEIFA